MDRIRKGGGAQLTVRLYRSKGRSWTDHPTQFTALLYKSQKIWLCVDRSSGKIPLTRALFLLEVFYEKKKSFITDIFYVHSLSIKSVKSFKMLFIRN